MSLTKVSYSMVQGAVANILDFGATTSDTTGAINSAAFSAALLAADSVFVPEGTFIVEEAVVLRGDVLSPIGQYIGKRLFGSATKGSVIKAKAGSTANFVVIMGNLNYPTDDIFSVGNSLEDISIDDTNLPDNVNFGSLLTVGTFNNTVKNVRQAVEGTIKLKQDIAVSSGTFTTSFYDVHGDNFSISSALIGNVTTIAFYNCSCTFLNIFGGVAINFDHLTIQGTFSGGFVKRRIQISQCANVSFVNGDLEGDGDMFTISNSSGITITGNNVAIPGTYRQGGTDQQSQFLNIIGCNQVHSRDNIFMNFTKAGAGVVGPPPYIGIYAVGSGANTQIAAYDFQGAYFTGSKYNASGAITLGGSGVNTIINFDNVIYDSPTRFLVDLTTTPITYNAGFPTTVPGVNWRFTAPIAGIYRVTASILLDAFVDATDSAILTLNVNAAEQARAFANKGNTASGDCFMQIQTDLKLLASDFIDARIAYTNAAFTIASAPTANTIAISYVGTI